MATTNLNSTVSRTELRKAIELIPKGIHGKGVTAQSILDSCGKVLLSHIRTAFLTKSKGGTDLAGDRWAPLKATTIAYSRSQSSRSRAEKKRNTRPSQILNSKQQNRWWELYRQGLAIHKGDKASAAKRAWFILKREGADTLINKYGNRKVDILYNTGKLFNSIESSVDSQGNIIISSDHPLAKVHHNGSAKKGIPKRRLWPNVTKWPNSWWKDILKIIRDGIVQMTAQASNRR